jgi:hypothetical protein
LHEAGRERGNISITPSVSASNKEYANNGYEGDEDDEDNDEKKEDGDKE